MKEENDVKVVLVPLSKSDQKTLEEDDALLRYMDATEVVAPTPSSEVVVIGEDDADTGDIDDTFRSKQVEAARALRARLHRGDRTIDGEAEIDDLDVPSRKESAMDEDEASDHQAENASDDEEEERQAVGIDFNGRHYFEDAVTKKNLTGATAFAANTKAQETDAFFNQPDEADYEWELELIRRSGVKRAHQSLGNAHASAKAKSDAKTLVEIQSIPERSMEPLAEDDIMKRLERDIAQLESVASLHENRLATIEASREEHTNFLATADVAYKQASEDLEYFEDFKLYMVDLMDCIESKLPLIQDVEEKMFQTRQVRVRKTQARIRSAFPQELESVRSGLDSGDLSPWKTWRRSRAKRDVQTKKGSSFSYDDPQLDLEEGFSSDEETSPESQSLYDSSLVDVRDAAIAVFDDAMPEFCDLGIILQKIADFRGKYPVSYIQAHLSKQLPQLLGPIVRLEILPWDPLKASNVFEWPWFECFEKFVAGAQGDSERQPSDAALLAELCTEVLLPKVKEAAKSFWRPNSLKDTENLQNLLGTLRHFLPPKPLSEILVSVNMSLKYAIHAFDLPSAQPTREQAQSDYAQVAFARCLKLVSIAISWVPYFSPDASRAIICDSIVNEKIVPYLRAMKSLGLAQRWHQAQLTIAALTSFLRAIRPDHAPRVLEDLQPLKELLIALEQESLGHYDSFEISQSVMTQWKAMHG